MEVCQNPKCGARLPNPNKSFQACRKCFKVSCGKCKATHDRMTCSQYQASQEGSKKPILANGVKVLPTKEEAPLVRSPPGISQKEASPKCGDNRVSQEGTQTAFRNEDLSLESTVLEDGEEVIAQCGRQGCSGAAIIAREDALFPCPVCKHFTCMKCKAVHESMTCEEYTRSKHESPNVVDQVANEQVSSFPSTEEEEDSEGAEGVIVNCLYGTCPGYGYVEKSATMAQCSACGHWTCRRCKASHEGTSCAQYGKGIEKDEHPADIVGCVYEATALSGNTIQCINPKCGSTLQAESAQAPVVCPNMCGGQCYICPHCRMFMCMSCSPNQKGKGLFATVKDMLFKKENVPKPVPNVAQGAVPIRQRDVPTADIGNNNNEAGTSQYRKCWNMSCMKYCALHEGPCHVRGDGQFDKAFKPPSGKDSCDLCHKAKYAMTIEACEHRLCGNCIETTVKKAYVDEVMCPVKQSSGRCSGLLSKHDIAPNVSRETYSKYKKMLFWEKMQCHGRKCQAWVCVDPTSRSMNCPKCGVVNCITCRACHPGKTCEAYVEWLVIAMDKGLLEDPVEKERRFREQQELYEKDIVPNSEEFDCVVCYSEVEPGNGLVLKNCHHSICKDCLVRTIEQSESADVQCPCLAEGDQPCTMNILDDEIKAVLSAEGYEAFLEKGFIEAERKAANSFHCKTVNCRGWCIYDVEVNTFQCPVCGLPNCLRCEAIHPNVTCEVYQADLKRRAENDAAAKASIKFLEDQLEQGAAMRCPTCKVVVIKRSGCDFIQCASCKTGLCWATKGARWGPRGAGDNSGGCRCGVNGVKCHPTCTTCH